MRICFAIDDINFNGGAHIATSAFVHELLGRGEDVRILTMTQPGSVAKQRFPVKEIMVCPYPTKGVRKIIRGIINHLQLYWFPNWTLDPHSEYRTWLAKHDVVCCVGEPSYLRQLVSALPSNVRKVMMIHTDYVTWSGMSGECRRVSRWDRFWYARYDAIGVIGTVNADRMASAYPRLAHKILPFHNLMIVSKHEHQGRVLDDDTPVRMVSLSRIEGAPKFVERYLRVAVKLKEEGLRFDWTVYGDGPDLMRLRSLAIELGIDDVFHLVGFVKDAAGEIGKYDLLILLSSFEGLPNTIYEAFLSGTPVFSTDVGGIAEQISEGVNGWLVRNDFEKITQKLRLILRDRASLSRAAENLRGYRYDNDAALREHYALFGVERV